MSLRRAGVPVLPGAEGGRLHRPTAARRVATARTTGASRSATTAGAGAAAAELCAGADVPGEQAVPAVRGGAASSMQVPATAVKRGD